MDGPSLDVCRRIDAIFKVVECTGIEPAGPRQDRDPLEHPVKVAEDSGFEPLGHC